MIERYLPVLAEILADVLDIDAAEISIDSQFDDFEIDSISVVEMVMRLEEHFGIDIEARRLRSLKRVEELVALLDQLVQAKTNQSKAAQS
jgi:acyl carrier protein